MKHLQYWFSFLLQPTLLLSLLFFSVTLMGRRQTVIMLLLLVTVFFPSYSQPTLEWDQTLFGNRWDHLSALQQTRDGGYLLGGYSESDISTDKSESNKGGNDFWVVKLDAAGNKQWDKTIGGNDSDDLTRLQQTSDGGYILGGRSTSGISGDKTEANKGDSWVSSDYWVIKLDAAGNKTWDKTIGGNDYDELTWLQQTSDGGYMLGGYSSSSISGDKTEDRRGDPWNWSIDYWVVKLDAAGNKQWDKTVGGNEDDRLLSLQQTSDGGYVLGGYSTSGIGGDKTQANKGFCSSSGCSADYWIVKLDGAGNMQWNKTIGGSRDDYLFSLQQTTDGGFVLGGSSTSPISGDKTEVSRGDSDFWLVKLDAAGNRLWDKTFGGNDSDDLRSLQQTSDGGYLLGGSSASGISGDKTEAIRGVCSSTRCWDDYWVVRLDAAGNKVWDITIGGDKGDFLTSMQITSDGGLVLGGNSVSPLSGEKTETSESFDYWVVKLSPLLREQVSSFTLVNTEIGQAFQTVQDGDSINLAELPTQKLSIQAITNPVTVGSVRFELSGQHTRIQMDSEGPYSLFGDSAGMYHAWIPVPGNYTLTARPFSLADGQGTAGTPLTIHFTLFSKQAGPSVAWDRIIGSKGGLQSIQQTSDGGYILGGYSFLDSSDTTNTGNTGNNTRVLKLDANANVVWDKNYGGNGNTYLSALQQASDGGYVLGGWSGTPSSDGTMEEGCELWIVRLDSAGNKTWGKTLAMSCHNSLVTLQQTGDGGYILGGSYQPYDKGDDYWVLKLDAAGNKVWEKTIGGYDMDFFTFLQPSGDGGYILGGTSFSEISRDKTQNSNGLSDYWLVKLDAAGDKLWDKTIGADDFDYLRALQPTSDGGYVLGGVSFSGKSGDKTEEAKGYIDYWLVKVDAAGNKQWDRTIGGSEHNELITLQQTNDGGYILGGHSNSPKSGDKSENQKGNNSAYDNFDYWAVKLDSVGNKEWDKTLGGSEGELLQSLQQTFDGGYILGGLSQSPISGNKTQANIRETEFWVVKLAPMPGKEQVKSFTLINTESEQPIRTLRDGDSLDLAALPRKLNIRADTHPDTVGSVLFELSGKQARTQVENELPYALFGDIRGDYEKWYPAPGSYTLRATPYSQPNGQGHAGTPLTIHFTVEPPRIVSFTLINTESEQPIRTLRDGDSLDLAALPRKLNIRADTRPSTVGSVRFELSGPREKIYQDNAMPYALFGDVKGDYNKWYPDPGSYMLSATPYTGRDAGGHGGALLSIRFTVVRNQKTLLAARMEQAAGAARAELAHSLRLYPNPTSDGRLQLQLASQLSGQIRYCLLSAVGRKLAEGTFTFANGGTLFSLDFSRQLRAPGLYYLKLEGANMHQVLKIMRR